MNIKKYMEAITSKDRVITGLKDINNEMIKVGDAILPIGETEIYYVNYSPESNCYYGLGINNKILNHKKFAQTEIVGVGIFKKDFEQICE